MKPSEANPATGILGLTYFGLGPGWWVVHNDPDVGISHAVSFGDPNGITAEDAIQILEAEEEQCD